MLLTCGDAWWAILGSNQFSRGRAAQPREISVARSHVIASRCDGSCGPIAAHGRSVPDRLILIRPQTVRRRVTNNKCGQRQPPLFLQVIPEGKVRDCQAVDLLVWGFSVVAGCAPG